MHTGEPKRASWYEIAKERKGRINELETEVGRVKEVMRSLAIDTNSHWVWLFLYLVSFGTVVILSIILLHATEASMDVRVLTTLNLVIAGVCAVVTAGRILCFN